MGEPCTSWLLKRSVVSLDPLANILGWSEQWRASLHVVHSVVSSVCRNGLEAGTYPWSWDGPRSVTAGAACNQVGIVP